MVVAGRGAPPAPPAPHSPPVSLAELLAPPPAPCILRNSAARCFLQKVRDNPSPSPHLNSLYYALHWETFPACHFTLFRPRISLSLLSLSGPYCHCFL